MERKFYEQLLNWKNKNVLTPLMVIGARQVGKTYIINEFCQKEFNDYIYINLLDNKSIVSFFAEDIDTKDKIEKMKLYLNRQITENTVIFFDEIQESEQLISALKYFCENDFPYKIVCAGSLLGVKLNRFKSSFPVGKVRILKMYPMDFEEFLIALGEEMAIKQIKSCYENNEQMPLPLHEKHLKYYRLYLCSGGMPSSVDNLIKNNLDILNFDREILNSIVISYLADMTKYVTNKFESAKIERIYNTIPKQLLKKNKKFMYSSVDKDARKRDYYMSLEWLISSNLVIPSYHVNKFEVPLKGYMDSDNFKLYLSDVGLLSSILNISYNRLVLGDKLEYLGTIAENYVANELVCNGFDLYYYSVNQVVEIDFLIETDNGVIPIEVKASDNVKAKTLNYYMEKYKPKYAIRISTKNFGFDNNIKSVPLYATFCIKKQSLNS